MTGRYVFKMGAIRTEQTIEPISYTNTRTPTPTFIMNLCYNCRLLMDARLFDMPFHNE